MSDAFSAFRQYEKASENVSGFDVRLSLMYDWMDFMIETKGVSIQHKENINKTKHQFPRGFYSSPKSIFDKLEEHDIVVPIQERLFPWFLVYYFEANLLPAEELNSQNLTWTTQHVPISVSVCSNVERFKIPHCIVEPHNPSGYKNGTVHGRNR